MWDKISVKKYYEILEILNDYKDEPITLNVALIDCIWDIDSASMPIPRFNYYMNELEFLQNPYQPKSPKKTYKVGDIEFCPIRDVSQITTAQYIDYQEFLKREDHKHILNVLFIPKGEDYGKSDHSELLWEKLSLPDYADVLFFFLRLLNNLTADTLRSSEKMMRKEYRREKDPQKKEELMNQMVQIHLALLQVNENE